MAPLVRRSVTARADEPAQAAIDLARILLDAGWTLSGAYGRVIHIVRLATEAGLAVAITSEAGQVHTELDSEYRRLGPDQARLAWHARTDGAPSIHLLTAIATANASDSAYRSDDTVTELLTAAGWTRPQPHHWIAPHRGGEVEFCDDNLEHIPLPWRIRRPGHPEFAATHDTPPVVIAAIALSEARNPSHPHTTTARSAATS